MPAQRDNADIQLTTEQEKFIKTALSGKNVLVDACIGSGKTTAIQHLCNRIPSDKHVLYLTYNKLLKQDAQKKIIKANVHVQNYHGYAYERLKDRGISVAQADLLREFNRRKMILPPIDILIIDEYQDIDTMSAEMLTYIKKYYPNIQIVMVGDMAQKIYDYTTLNVSEFVTSFIGSHKKMQFTVCFRLPSKWAGELGRTWGKTIIGVNKKCHVSQMTLNEAADFLVQQNPEDILCLGPRRGMNSYSWMLNLLESTAPDKFNKNTTYASIRDEDANVKPGSGCAIFTTYDSSKGLERKICVLMDWTIEYWTYRSNKPGQSYEILRNIFCVAASRGKENIIIVKSQNPALNWKTIRTSFKDDNRRGRSLEPSQIFNYAKQEYVDWCFSCLETRPLNTKKDRSDIDIPRTDGLIDVSPCIGIYQEAMYFDHYDIDKQIDQLCESMKISRSLPAEASLADKILYLTSLETGQERYRKQLDGNHLITDEQWQQITSRLRERLERHENVQVPCEILCDNIGAAVIGFADAVKDGMVYELKFTSELSRANFLQCALYMVGLGKETGILWNIRTNEIHEIRVRQRRQFLDALAALLSNGACRQFVGTLITNNNEVIEEVTEKTGLTPIANYSPISEESREKWERIQKKYDESRAHWLSVRQDMINNSTLPDEAEHIAVIDTETTWNDVRNLNYGTKFMDVAFSVGVVIADSHTMQPVKFAYYILEPECLERGMYLPVLEIAPAEITRKCSRQKCIKETKKLFKQYNVGHIFAYNASFDFRHLPELDQYQWHDIMSKAAYLDENPFLSAETGQFYSTGRLKRGRGMESIYSLVTGDEYFIETHNALFDAMDELQIMRSIGHDPASYLLLGEKHPSKQSKEVSKAKQRIGKERLMKCGLSAKIINVEHVKSLLNNDVPEQTIAASFGLSIEQVRQQ